MPKLNLDNYKEVQWLQVNGLTILNDHFLRHVKRQASRLRKNKHDVTHSNALDIISRSYGFKTWNHIQKEHSKQFSENQIKATFNYQTPDCIYDVHTIKQLHSAVYRFLNCEPLDQVIQFMFYESDFSCAVLELFSSERDCLNSLLKMGIIPDEELEGWTHRNDPHFYESDETIKAFRFIHPKPLTHQQAEATLDNIVQELRLVGFSLTCWPIYIWINGKLPDDIEPPDLEFGDDSLPVKSLPKELCKRVFK
ncbi:glyoxalase superfamily protein [Neptuniibacter pectenicola]|uniref:Glyoxalase superfamily protein n=1 Tax=Neptuniibacter pectenicola TaxID=1806669 RepID=A0ABU9TQU9_9GAMM